MELDSPGSTNEITREMLVVVPETNNDLYRNEKFRNSSIPQNHVTHPSFTQKGFSESINKTPQESECSGDNYANQEVVTLYQEQYQDDLVKEKNQDSANEDECQLEWIVNEDQSPKILGSGGFGVVYVARKSTNKQKQAIKILKITTDNILTLQNELDIHRGLKHKNIIRFLSSNSEILQPNEDLHIVMECIPGASLATLLKTDWNCGLLEEGVISYLKQLLDAMLYLHSKDIIHCDIKGENILINDYSAELKLCDFGLAHSLTKGFVKKLCGTVNFMAPEACRPPSEGFGKSADIWSIGCVVVEMLTGNPPFHELEELAIIYLVGSKSMCPSIPEFVSENCRRFLERCLTFEVSERATIEELSNHSFVKGGEKTKEGFEDSDELQIMTNDLSAVGAKERAVTVTGDIVIPLVPAVENNFDIEDEVEDEDEDESSDEEEDDQEYEGDNDEIKYQPHNNVAMVTNHKLGKDIKDTFILVARPEQSEENGEIQPETPETPFKQPVTPFEQTGTFIEQTEKSFKKAEIPLEQSGITLAQEETERGQEDANLTEFLRGLNIPQAEIDKFHHHECTYEGLINHMQLDDLKDLGLKIGHRAHIWDEVQKLRSQTPTSSTPAISFLSTHIIHEAAMLLISEYLKS